MKRLGAEFKPCNLEMSYVKSFRSSHHLYIYIVIYVCLLVYSIITHKHLDRFTSMLTGELRKATEML